MGDNTHLHGFSHFYSFRCFSFSLLYIIFDLHPYLVGDAIKNHSWSVDWLVHWISCLDLFTCFFFREDRFVPCMFFRESARIQFRLPDASTVVHMFPSSEPLSTAHDFILNVLTWLFLHWFHKQCKYGPTWLAASWFVGKLSGCMNLLCHLACTV